MPDKVLFFSVVDDSTQHQQFVIPFIASALITHPNASCEVRVPNPPQFFATFAKEFDSLIPIFKGRNFYVGPWPNELNTAKFKDQSSPGALVRFLCLPYIKRHSCTYISDIDMLFINDILPGHKAIMESTGFPYTNIIRPNTKRMTGCMMVKSKEYYDAVAPVIERYLSAPESIYYPISKDEELLYRLIEESSLPLPDPTWSDLYRPSSSIHTSLNRNIDMDGDWRESPPSWGLTPEKLQQAKALFATPEWQAMVFPKAYQENILDPIRARITVGEQVR